jgi:hypothetical protein
MVAFRAAPRDHIAKKRPVAKPAAPKAEGGAKSSAASTSAAKKKSTSGRSTSVRSSSMAGDRMPAAPVRGAQDVDAFMKELRHPFKAEVQAVREIILAANKKLAERIKWNAPSFYYGADLGAFNLHQTAYVQLILVFPNGLIDDGGAGLLMGTWRDRREVRFADMKDVLAKKAALRRVVNAWVERMDGKR